MVGGLIQIHLNAFYHFILPNVIDVCHFQGAWVNTRKHYLYIATFCSITRLPRNIVNVIFHPIIRQQKTFVAYVMGPKHFSTIQIYFTLYESYAKPSDFIYKLQKLEPDRKIPLPNFLKHFLTKPREPNILNSLKLLRKHADEIDTGNRQTLSACCTLV